MITKKHAQKTILALLAALLLAMTGNAWAVTVSITNIPASPSQLSGVLSLDYSSTSFHDLSSPTDTPVGEVGAATVTVGGSVFLNSAAGYNNLNSTFDTPAATAKNGIIDLKTDTLTLQPGTFNRISSDLVATHVIQESIGKTNDVLRLYDSSATNVTPPGSVVLDGSSGGAFRFSGGTYVEAGTLTVRNNATLAGGSVTLGSPADSWGLPTKLVDSVNLLIPTLKIADAYATLQSDGSGSVNTRITNLTLTQDASSFTILPKTGGVVRITGTYKTDANTSEIYIKPIGATNPGTLDFGSTLPNSKTSVNIASQGTASIDVTADKAFGTLTGPGTLRVGTGSGTLSVSHVSGFPILDINSHYATVALLPPTVPNYVFADVLGVGTLSVRGGTTTLQAPTTTGTPRLDIVSGATVIDKYNATTTRTFNGINGAGTLTLAAGVTSLDLTPVINSDFLNNIPSTVTGVVTLNAGAQNITQALRGNNDSVRKYTVTKGILEFAKPASIKSSPVSVDIVVGTGATLKLDYSGANYTFNGGATPSGDITVNNNSTIYMAPLNGNTCAASDDTTLKNTTSTFAGKKVM